MTILLVLFVLLLLVTLVTVPIVLIVRGSVKKTKWGINLEKGVCPRCQAPRPRVRKPANFRQAMWGGSTCQVCGLEVDKWGRPLPSQP